MHADEGFYGSLALGAGLMQDLDDSDNFTTEFWPGPVVSGAVGYKWRPVRFEGELFFGWFPMDEQTGSDGPRPVPPSPCFLCGVSDVNGDLNALAFLANAYLDLELTDNTNIYLGGGAGGASVAADYDFNVSLIGLPADEISFVDDRDNVFAYQARIGFGFDFTEQSEAYLGYRFFATEDLSFDTESGGSLKQDGLTVHIGEIGIRVSF